MDTSNTAGQRLQKGFGAGVGAALAFIVAMTLVRLTVGIPSLPELLQGVFLRLVPGDVFEFMIHWLGPGAKVLLLVQVLWGIMLVGGLLGWLFVRQWRPPPTGASPFRILISERTSGGLLYGAAIGVALIVVWIVLFYSGLMNPQPGDDELLPVALSLAIYGVVYGMTLVTLLPWEAPLVPSDAVPVADESRRGFMRMAGGTALALVGGVGLWGLLTALLREPDAVDLVAEGSTPAGGTAVAVIQNDLATAVAQSAAAVPTGTAAAAASATTTPATAAAGATPTTFPAVPVLPPEITPTDNFYITTKNFSDPTVNGSTWKLTIKGLVDHPTTLTLADLQALPQVKVVHTLECISNTIGGDLIGNAVWTGVRVADLLGAAGIQKGAVEAIFRADDDYSDSIPAAVLMDPDTMLVYEMNGAPLTTRHGYPARLLIPGIYGMKNVKWLTSIEVVNYDYKGFWQSQGWSDPAPYQTHSRIDFPQVGNVPRKPLYIGGNAFAGNRGIQRVEVSLDGGQTWADAQLRRPLGRNTWVFWTFPWVPEQPGRVTIVARATDGTGQVQSGDDRNNYPDGAFGYHRVQVNIVNA